MLTAECEGVRMQPITVWDSVGPTTLQGEVVVDRTWSYEDARRSGHVRWTDITLYHIKDPAYPDCVYAIQVVARSVVYHRVGGCSRGVRMPVSRLAYAVDEELYEVLEPCTEAGCQPSDLDDLKDDDLVSVEVNWYKRYQCSSAEDVVRTLANIPKKLAHTVLQAASQVNPEIAQAAASWRRA